MLGLMQCRQCESVFAKPSNIKTMAELGYAQPGDCEPAEHTKCCPTCGHTDIGLAFLCGSDLADFLGRQYQHLRDSLTVHTEARFARRTSIKVVLGASVATWKDYQHHDEETLGPACLRLIEVIRPKMADRKADRLRRREAPGVFV